MRTIPRLAAVIGMLVIVHGARAAETSGQRDLILLQRCSVDYARSTMIGTNYRIGLVQEIHVRVGEHVKSGQMLVTMFDKDAKAQKEAQTVDLEIAELDILQKNAALEVAKTQMQRAAALYAKRSLSAQNLQLEKLRLRTAELEYKEAIQKRRLAESQLQVAVADYAVRHIVSPHDGVVVDVFKHVGESVFSGEAANVFRVVQISRMQVTGYLDVGDAWRVRPGHPVRAKVEIEGVELPVESETFTGKVTFVDSEIDPKTRTCRVFAELENRGGLLRSGLECSLEIDVSGPGESPPGAPTNASATVSSGVRTEARK